jgi:Bacterial SH3 domain
MKARNIFPVILFIASMPFVGCSNDGPAAEAPRPSPATAAATPSQTPAATTPKLQEDTVGESVPALPESTPTESNPKPNTKAAKPKTPFKSNTTVAAKKENPAGNPTGYIGRENIVLYGEPSTNAQNLGTLKINESVIILETKMTDETGKSFPMPQWYKVQLTNKKVGWVVGRSITIN